MALVENQTVTVKRGDCAWKVAERNLKAENKKVTNAEIIKEMNRLAKENGCENVKDFNKKYFGGIGKEVIIHKANRPIVEIPVEHRDTTLPQSSIPTIRLQPEEIAFRPEPVKPITEKPIEITDPAKAKPAPKEKTKKQTAVTAKQIEENLKNGKYDVNSPEYLADINKLKSDEEKIIQHNKHDYDGEYYGIVDKKSCKLKIYDKDGKVVKSFTIGVGRKKGDDLESYYLERAEKTDKQDLAETGRYTTPGEFTLDEYVDNGKSNEHYRGRTDNKLKIMALKGDNRGVRSGQTAIHMLYKPDYAKRERAINSPGLADNRMSYGCVNLTEEDYDIMHTYLGEGDKLYILPEEKGNKLILEAQNNGTTKFNQAYHRDDVRSHSAEVASRVTYDVRPERNPVYIAQQKAKAAEEAKPKFNLFRPSTWFA